MGTAPAATTKRLRAALLVGAAAAAALVGLVLTGGGPEPEPAPEASRTERADEVEPEAGPEVLDTSGGAERELRAPGPTERPPVRPADPTLRPDQVDLFVVDPLGAPLLERGSSPLPSAVLIQLRVCLVEAAEAPSRVDPGLAPLPRTRRVVRDTPGWVNRFDRPESAAHCVLVLGTEVVSSAPVLSGEEGVRIVASAEDVLGRLCTVRGEVAGLEGAARHVLIVPRRVAGVRAANISAQPTLDASGQLGEGFEFRHVPPGPCRLRVHLTVHHLVRQLQRTTDPGASLSLGPRVPDREQWDLRLAALARARHPFLELELDLAAGEELDLGRIAAPDAGVVVLQLRDEQGAPVEAQGVEVRRLAAEGELVPDLTTWTFENQVAVFPLPPGEVTLAVGQGELGSLQTLVPRSGTQGAMGLPVDVRLARVAVVDLSAVVASRLTTETGVSLGPSKTWAGGSYRGQSLGGQVMIVPPARYRVELEGGSSWVQVEPAALVRVGASGAAESEPLPAAETKKLR